jgi:hypothetical protein
LCRAGVVVLGAILERLLRVGYGCSESASTPVILLAMCFNTAAVERTTPAACPRAIVRIPGGRVGQTLLLMGDKRLLFDGGDAVTIRESLL